MSHPWHPSDQEIQIYCRARAEPAVVDLEEDEIDVDRVDEHIAVCAECNRKVVTLVEALVREEQA